MKRHSSAIAALLVTALMAGGALAQPAGTDTGGAADKRADRRDEAADKDREKKSESELELCKAKAQGLDGPERARFFTNCLRGPGRS
jgi:hypothetical protein